MSKALVIDTGVVEYTINDAVTVKFNPTDFSFVERLFSTFDELDKKQEDYKAEIEAASDNVAVFDAARKMDAEMREYVNAVFEQDVCTELLGNVNIYALADGLPIWANLMLALIDEVDTSYAREQKATNPRLQKYMKKYKKS